MSLTTWSRKDPHSDRVIWKKCLHEIEGTCSRPSQTARIVRIGRTVVRGHFGSTACHFSVSFQINDLTLEPTFILVSSNIGDVTQWIAQGRLLPKFHDSWSRSWACCHCGCQGEVRTRALPVHQSHERSTTWGFSGTTRDSPPPRQVMVESVCSRR